MAIVFEETRFGFNYGPAIVERICHDEKKGWTVIGIFTPKHKDGDFLNIYITKTGKIRISDSSGEWSKPSKEL